MFANALDRKQAEEELREAEIKYRMVADFTYDDSEMREMFMDYLNQIYTIGVRVNIEFPISMAVGRRGQQPTNTKLSL